MLISRKADYAVRTVLFLAERASELVATPEIAQHIEVTDSFAAKVLQGLHNAGIVESIRGTRGGYRLVKDPGHVTMLDVIEAIQGPIQLNECVVDGVGCGRSGHCPVHPFWYDLREEVEARLKRVTFATLLEQDGAVRPPT